MDGGQIGKLTVFDISKSGEQIGEKLFALLNPKQQQELVQYVLTKEEREWFCCFHKRQNAPYPFT